MHGGAKSDETRRRQSGRLGWPVAIPFALRAIVAQRNLRDAHEQWLAPAPFAPWVMTILVLTIWLGACSPPPLAAQGDEQARSVDPEGLIADVDGPIDDVMARFITRVLSDAEEDEASLVVLRVDTPGGRLSSTREIVTAVLESPVPVVSYVAPRGARAASAGTFIVASAGVAAMAPSTNIGAASPVAGSGEDLPDTLSQKAKEDAAAFIRSIAEERDRNPQALEETVYSATAFSASEAEEEGVIDLMASDMSDLLEQLDGRSISTSHGEETLSTEGMRLREIDLSVVERVLSFLASPDIAFLLFSLGGLALVVELWSPGLVGPGVIGVILLLLAFAGLGSLPFSWIGVALLVLAFILIFVETQVPGFGLFGIAGAVSLVLGGLFLFGDVGPPEISAPSVSVSPWLLGVVGGLFAASALWFARELRASRRTTGYIGLGDARSLTGAVATVTRRLDPDGEVMAGGEIWNARLIDGDVAEAGAEVVVRNIKGFRLEVAVQDSAAAESPPSARER